MGKLLGTTLAAAAVLVAAGCGTVGPVSGSADKSAGKQLFVQKCGYCHTLSAAGTSGKVGPNLDDAFASDRAQGFRESTIRDVVHDQIAYAIAPMPSNLVRGQDSEAVSAYVGSVAGVAEPAGGVAAAPVATASPSATTSAAPTTTSAPTVTSGVPIGNPGSTGSTSGANAGKALYASLGCQSCHTLDGTPSTGPTFKGLAGSTVRLKGGKSTTADMAYLIQSIEDPDAQIVDGFPAGVMRAVIKPHSVTQPDAQALVRFIQQQK